MLSVQAENFMPFAELDLEFPERGAVLVTGANGAGKSSLVEAAAVACWNKTLRGTPWFREGERSWLRCLFSEAGIYRERTRGGHNKLELAGAGQAHDNATKAQEQLNSIVPPFEMWRRTSVFTSAAVEGLHFASERDSERKRAVERVLGIDRFDEALDRLRVDAKRAEGEILELEKRREVAQARMEAERRRRDEAVAQRERLAKAQPPLEEGIDPASLRADLDTRRRDKKELESAIAGRSYAQRAAKASYESVRREECPTCTQKIPGALRARFELGLAEATKALGDLIAKAEGGIQDLEAEIEELDEAVRELEARRRARSIARDVYERGRRGRDEVEGQIRGAEAARALHELEVNGCSESIARARQDLGLLGAVERVLGLRGVRAHVIANALLGLSAVANKWLSVMDVPIQVSILPYTEKQSGGVAETISIGIEGAGAGYGYRACSAGQRRVVDVANILALATMFQAAQGGGDSTLFFDECFDVLDDEYARGVARALDEMGGERCVIVVSHSSALARTLAPVDHWHVEGGKVLAG